MEYSYEVVSLDSEGEAIELNILTAYHAEILNEAEEELPEEDIAWAMQNEKIA